MLYGIARPRTRTGTVESIPAPIGGWNARDPVSAMEKSDAIDLENLFPTPADVMLRQGFSDQVTAVPGGQVESLMAYSSPAGTEALYCAAGTAIYNCTQATATSSTAASGFANARWQHTNFTNTSGNSFLLMVNGANGLWSYNGSAWAAQVIGVTASASAFTNIAQHKRRLWFTKSQTLEAWYLNTDAVAGTANRLDLSSFMRKGGELQAIGTWTIDAGEGMDDYWVAASTEGEIVVYKGSDPTSATDWSMVGRWELGRPLSRRCFAKFGGDLLYLADDGVTPAPTSRVILSNEYISNQWVTSATAANPTRSTFSADTELAIFPDDVMVNGLKFHWYKAKGMDYAETLAEFLRSVSYAQAQDTPAPTLSLAPEPRNLLIGLDNVPDGNFPS